MSDDDVVFSHLSERGVQRSFPQVMADPAGSKDLPDDIQIAIYQDLLALSTNMQLPHGALKKTADKLKTSRWTVDRIWKRRLDAETPDGVVKAVRKRKKGRVGRKRSVDAAVVNEARMNTPLRNRRTLRHLSEAIGIPNTTLWRLLRDGEIRRVRSSLKPLLNKEKKMARVKWALSKIDPHSLKFSDMMKSGSGWTRPPALLPGEGGTRAFSCRPVEYVRPEGHVPMRRCASAVL